MKIFLLVLFFVASTRAQMSNEFSINPKSSTVVGNFNLLDLTGNKITLKAPTVVTPYSLTWPGTVSAGCLTTSGAGVLTWSSCVSLPIDDTVTHFKSGSDPTKLLRLNVTGISTGNTRVITVPDASIIMAGINLAQSWTSDQTLAANLLFSGLRDIGQSGAPASNIYTNQIRVPAGPCFRAGMTDQLVYTQNTSCVTVAELDGSGVEILGSGSLRVTGTQVIDSTRRLLNISTVASSLIPSAAATYSLGDSTAAGEWFQLYVRQIPAVENINPKNATSDIGYNGAGGYFRAGYFQNITVSGTCTGCGSVPVATQFTIGTVSTTNQSFGGNKTFFGSIIPGSSGTYSNGTSSFRWFETWANTGNFTTVIASSGSIPTLSVNGTMTINTVQGVFPGTGFIGTTGNRIGEGNFTSLSTSQFGSSNIFIGGGNFHNLTFAGSPSCAGRVDGWQGVDTFNLRIWVCIGGTARYATLF